MVHMIRKIKGHFLFAISSQRPEFSETLRKPAPAWVKIHVFQRDSSLRSVSHGLETQKVSTHFWIKSTNRNALKLLGTLILPKSKR
jgi:hypothetical protein